MTQAPLKGQKGRQASDRSWEDRGQAPRPHRGRRRAHRPRGGGGSSGMTSRWCERLLRVFPSSGRHRPRLTPQGLGLDKGDDDDEGRDLCAAFGCTAHLRARGEEAKALKQDAGVRARRWVVERTHSWLNRFRRVLIRWDKKVRNHLGFLHFACAYITYRQSGLVG